MNSQTALNLKIKNAPLEPGCYVYRDVNNSVIYVGKAKNIRKRVQSYFNEKIPLEPKIKIMVSLISSVEFIVTDSELEALILETNLIKKYLPKYNRLKKDDKNYVWIMITKKEDFPRILLVRDKKIKNAEYIGPFTNPLPIRRILKDLRKIFMYRTCNRVIKVVSKSDHKETIQTSDPKPCLYYFLNLCDAPCAGYSNSKKYKSNILFIKKYFQNQKSEILGSLKKQMQKASQKKDFEIAAQLRDKINDLLYISENIKVDLDSDEDNYNILKEKSRHKGLEELLQKLNLPIKKNFRIECYDISNIQGTNAVGSMIVFIDGKPENKYYRKFKIKTKDTPDDFAMLKEIFTRRFAQRNISNKKFGELPDLVVVDGGKGQLSSTFQILLDKKLSFNIIGLAKKNEEIFLPIPEPEGLLFKKYTFNSNSEAKFLMQRIRDESHRFAINYHRQLRSFGQNKSVLDDIPGVGSLTKKRLLQVFGNVENIEKAKLSELSKIVKNKKTAQNIKKLLASLSVN